MNAPLRVDIDTLILDGIEDRPGLRGAIHQAIEVELRRLQSAGGTPSEAQIGQSVQQAIHQALAGKKGSP